MELNDDLLGRVLSHLGVVTLSRKKELSTLVIERKAPSPIKPFQSNAELREAILNYIQDKDKEGYEERFHFQAEERFHIQAEEIASTYGWPIGK